MSLRHSLLILQGITELTVTNSYQLQATETIDLDIILNVADSYQLQVTESPTLAETGVLVIANPYQLQVTETPGLIMELIITNSYQLQVIGLANLIIASGAVTYTTVLRKPRINITFTLS